MPSELYILFFICFIRGDLFLPLTVELGVLTGQDNLILIRDEVDLKLGFTLQRTSLSRFSFFFLISFN